MYSIQELVEVCKAPLQAIERSMDAVGGYHPDDNQITDGLKRSVAKDVMESIRKIPLTEYLTRSGTSSTAGIAGSNYLIPVKLHDQLVYAARDYEITPRVSAQVINGWAGGTLDVPITIDGSLRGVLSAGGAKSADSTPAYVKATLDPKLINVNLRIDNSLVEDNQFGLLDWCVRQAAQAIAWKENDITLDALIAGDDGDGTVNSSATGDADETMLTNGTTSDVVTAIRGIGYDGFTPDTLITTTEAWCHSISMHAAPTGWDNVAVGGFNARLGPLGVIFNNSGKLHASTDALDAAFTNCVSIVFDRGNALVSGRKRWMQIENYSDPVRDLSGAVVSSRVGSVSAYNDSIYVLTET